MKRRDFMKAAGAAALALSGGKAWAGSSTAPNILLFLVDSLRTELWSPYCRTPNLDRLTENGVFFSNHFVSATPCSPSRACLFTGTYTIQNRMFLNCDFTEGDRQPALNPRLTTLGHMFQRKGYQTPYFGKWHLSKAKDRRGRKEKLGEYGFTDWKPPDAPFGGPPYGGAVLDPLYAGEAVSWLKQREHHSRPWFLTVSLVNPHDVAAFPRFYPQRRLREVRSEAPPNWKDDLAGKPGAQLEYRNLYNKIAGKVDPDDEMTWRRCLDYYLHCTEDMDENLGKVLETLEKSPSAANTIVVFTSDHGEMAGSHGLRGKDKFVYEEKMRVPLIISGPGLPRGKTVEALCSNVDVMPTLLALAGINKDLPYLAGKDLSPLLTNPECQVREEVLLFHDSEIRTPGTIGDKAPSNFKHPTHIRCLRDREWKYAYYFRPGTPDREYELYNLKEDPLEMTNLAQDPGYRKKRKELHERLSARIEELEKEFSL